VLLAMRLSPLTDDRSEAILSLKISRSRSKSVAVPR
jgi:hypothetical protein